MAELSGKLILEALVASGFPSAKVRVFYNKLINRRNKALADLGLDYPPIMAMDSSEEFDYDPQKDAMIEIVTSRNETIAAPDIGWVVVKGRVHTRADVESRAAAKDIEKHQNRCKKIRK